MASTNKTANYDLSQFIETDKPGWLTDYNSDMRKIDSNLKSVSDEASGASADLSDLTDRVSTAESAITTNTNNITSLDARTDTLEAQAQSSAAAITNLQTEQTTQNLGIEAATKLGYNIARPYDAASTYAVGDYVLFQNTLYKCITAIPVGEEFVPAKWLAIKVMDEFRTNNEGFEITPINADNFPLTISNLYASTQQFNDSSPTEISLSNPVLSFYSADSFYAKYKNMRMLYLAFRLSFSNISISASSGFLTRFSLSIPSFIDRPIHPLIRSENTNHITDINQTKFTLGISGVFSAEKITQNLHNSQSLSLSNTDMMAQIIYITN